jgi:hypothetical protein
MDRFQYTSLLDFIQSSVLYQRGIKYMPLRPPTGATPSVDPRRWWRFAINAIMTDNRERRTRASWEFIKNRTADRKQYIENYKSVIRGEKIPTEKKLRLDSLESRFDYDDIILFRKAAHKVVESENKAKKELKKAVATASATSTPVKGSSSSTAAAPTTPADKTPKKGFFDRLFSKSEDAPAPATAPTASTPATPTKAPETTAPSVPPSPSPPISIIDTSQALKELYEGMGFDDQTSAKTKYPVGYVITALTFAMPSARINVRDDFKPETIVAGIDLQQARFKLQIRDGRSWRVEAGLNDFVVTDFFTKRPHIAAQNGGKLDPEAAKMLILRKASSSHAETSTQSSLASVVVDLRPPGLKKNNLPVDLAIDVSLMPSDVTVSRPLLDRIAYIFAPPTGNSVATRSVTEAASNFATDAFETFKRRARQSLKYAMENRQVYDIRFTVHAPRITAPRSFDSPTSPALVVNLGRGEITSDVSAIATSLESSQFGDNFFYDTFQINLAGVSAFLVPNMQAAHIDWNDTASISHMAIVNRTDVGGVIQLASVATAKIPRIKVGVSVKKLHLNVSRESLETSLSILESVFYSQESSAPKTQTKSAAESAAERGYDYVVNQLMDAETRAKLVDAASNTLASAATAKILFADLSFELNELEIDITQRLQLGSGPATIPLAYLDLRGVSASISASNEDITANFMLVGLFVEDALVERSENLMSLLEAPQDVPEDLTASTVDLHMQAKELAPYVGEKIYLLKSGSQSAVEGQPLIHVKLTVLNRSSPKFAGTDMLASVSLGSIDISASRPTAAALLQFTVDISELYLAFGSKSKKTAPSTQPASSEPSAVVKALNAAVAGKSAESVLESALQNVGVKEQSSRYIDIVFDFAGFRFALKKGKKEFFEARFTHLHASAEVHKNMMIALTGSLRELSARDLDDPKWGGAFLLGDPPQFFL